MRAPIAALVASFLSVLVAGCGSTPPPPPAPRANAADAAAAPTVPGPAWQPVLPRSPIVLDRKDVDPNVPSGQPIGNRLPVGAVRAPRTGEPALVLPDGTRLPSLNGVVRGPVMKANRPVPAVVAIVVDERGFEWYEHADGSLSTCRYVWRAETKRWEAVAMHAEPNDSK